MQERIKEIEKDYIKITKHEEIMVKELKEANERVNEQVKKIKERLEIEICDRIEEKERDREIHFGQQVKKLNENFEKEKKQAL